MNSLSPRVAPLTEQLRGGPATLAAAFIDSLDRFPDRTAMMAPDGKVLSYRDLGERTADAVRVLRTLGVGAGDRIAICLSNRMEWAPLTYAAALVGACVVPINVRYRPDEMGGALVHSEARLLFTETSFLSNHLLERLQAFAGGPLGQDETVNSPALPHLKHVVVMADDAPAGMTTFDRVLARCVAAEIDLAALAAERRPEEPMWLFWTSGTTSAPKGAVLPQSAVDMVWRWTTLAGYRSDDRILMTRPLFYIAGHFWSLIAPMLHGACTVVAGLFTPEEMIDASRRAKVTILSGNPLLLKRLVQAPAFDPEAFATVRLGYFGGSALPLEEMQAIQAKVGFRELIQTYGMTEYGGFVLSTLPGDSIEVASASCGVPFTEVRMRLVHPDTGVDVARGEVGMLMTHGQMFLRYLGLSAADQARLFDGGGWFRSGDLMRELEDGRYVFVGRSKDLIKVGGENVTAAEIEEMLMQHPLVGLAAVIGLPHADKGEVPAAFVEARDDAVLDTSAILAWCKTRMAPHKIPVRIQTVSATQWPMTSSGKIAKHELTGLIAAEDAS